MNITTRFVTSVALVTLTGCAVGPDYQRPALDVPAGYRQPSTMTNSAPDAASFGDLGWWEVYEDPQLVSHLHAALTNNYDMKVATARVMQAMAASRIARSEYFPTIAAGGDLATTRASQRGPSPVPSGVDPQSEFGDVFVSMPAYELDLWGRIRRSNEAALARLLATEEARKVVRQTLVAQVATAYLELLELDLELVISQSSYASRSNSLELTTARFEGGVAAQQDVEQSAILVHSADAIIIDTRRRIEQKENELNLLLGCNPGSIERGLPLAKWTLRSEVPAGMPSSLLERRPDIRAAEEQLRAVNADIGQAKAAYFPQVTLTGFYGFQSVSFSDLFTGAARTWQFGPSVTVPLFTGGRLKAEVELQQARFDEALAVYQQTVQRAFAEVSDALIAYERTRQFRTAQEKRTESNRKAADLAKIRYEGGVTSYLEVLYNEQELLTAELNLAVARRNELLSVVQLYRALGGGFHLKPSAAKERDQAVSGGLPAPNP
jgi:multidrug efflux system outer membrane protein